MPLDCDESSYQTEAFVMDECFISNSAGQRLTCDDNGIVQNTFAGTDCSGNLTYSTSIVNSSVACTSFFCSSSAGDSSSSGTPKAKWALVAALCSLLLLKL